MRAIAHEIQAEVLKLDSEFLDLIDSHASGQIGLVDYSDRADAILERQLTLNNRLSRIRQQMFLKGMV